MISLQHVSKAYPLHHRQRMVLDDISLDIPPRENIGILGRNGQGKSTLLRIIAGTEQPDSGRVTRSVRVSWPIGFSGGANPVLTGEENARFVSRIYGCDVDAVTGRVFEFSELGEYFYAPVNSYSAGMKARLAFAMSMAIDFDTYLIDEVIAVGDQPFQEKCRRALMEQNEKSSVIIVSHNLGTIRKFSDKCAVLLEGKLQLFDDLDEAAHVYQQAQ